MTNFPWPMDKPIEEIEEEVERNKDGYDQFVLSDIRYLLARLKKAESERDASRALAEGFMIQEEQE